MADEQDALEEAVIEFYREEIRRRYLIENMQRFEQFKGVPDALLNDLREFFLASIYPPLAMRRQLDHASDQLRGLLRSPKLLAPLLRTAITSMLRLGTQVPAAVSAGLGAVDALREARKLEVLMMEAARELHITPEHQTDRDAMLRVIASVPKETHLRLVHDLIDLFTALSNVKMLSAMFDIMERCLKVMDSRPELYEENLRAGVKLGLAVLRGGLDLFLEMKPKDFPRVIKGIEMVEMDWFNTVREEQAA